MSETLPPTINPLELGRRVIRKITTTS